MTFDAILCVWLAVIVVGIVIAAVLDLRKGR